MLKVYLSNYMFLISGQRAWLSQYISVIGCICRGHSEILFCTCDVGRIMFCFVRWK